MDDNSPPNSSPQSNELRKLCEVRNNVRLLARLTVPAMVIASSLRSTLFSPRLVLTTLAIGMTVGCSNDPERLPSLHIDSPAVSVSRSTSCEAGAERVCGVTLDLENDIVTCFRGVQTCEESAWSDCKDGVITKEPARKSTTKSLSLRKTLALSTSEPCTDPANPFYNACDPGCMYFEETLGDELEGPLELPRPPLDVPTFSRECSTDVCTASTEPLELGCDPCITTVCSAYPSCCEETCDQVGSCTNAAWDASCVDAAAELCAAVTITPGLCDFGLFADKKIVTANRPSANASIGSYGDITMGTDGELGGGIFSKGSIEFKSLNGAEVHATEGLYADGNIISQNSSSKVSANLYAGGYIYIPAWEVGASFSVNAQSYIQGQNSTKIPGWANTNDTITNVSLLGTTCEGTDAGGSPCYTHVPISLPPQTSGTAIPTLTTECPASGVDDYIVSGGNTSLTPGTYGDIDLTNGGDLTLDGEGTYYFRSLKAGVDADIVLKSSNGTAKAWNVRVCNEVVFRDRTKIASSNATENDSKGVLLDGSLLILYSDYSGTMTWNDKVFFSGVFIAPKAKLIKLGGGSGLNPDDINAGTVAAPINGALWVNELDIGTDGLTHQIPGATCEALGIPGSLPVCQAPTITTGTQNALNTPCRTGRDCQMNHRCENPDTDDSCSHSKCKEGDALNDSCDECVQRICNRFPSCCAGTGSWTNSCVDKVATICDATCDDDNESGECLQNNEGYEDATCAGYDLALDIPCDDEIPICNHGTAEFVGDVTVAYWKESEQQLSFESPAVDPDGTCDFSDLTIPAGTCIIEDCPLPGSDLHTLMLDPKGTQPGGECDSHRLDNWSVHARLVCPDIPVVDPVDEIQIYEAYCPVEDTGALWSLVGWNTETSGTSKVRISGVVANTSEDLDEAMVAVPSEFVDIGVAQWGPVPQDPVDLDDPINTEVCGLTSTCMGDIAGALELGTSNHGQFLGLRISIEPGIPTATLKDWFVTYSCVYDQ